MLTGNEIESLPSFQGFKGAINTPNANIYKEGEFEFLYSNNIDTLSESTDGGADKTQENYFLNMGMLPNLDVSFRYTYSESISDAYDSDLSDRMVNLKYQLPFIPKDLFQIALGIQDAGGGYSRIHSNYAVLSKEYKNIRASIGYAQGDNVGSLDGPFGSVEYQPFSWLNIAGEYDSNDWNSAIKANYLTEIGKQRINLGLIAKSSTYDNEIYFGLYANMPFHNKAKHEKINIKNIPSSIEALKAYGFSNIAYRIEKDILYFEYENTLYTYNDIDALGMVLGTLAMSNKASTIVVVSKKSNIRQLTTTIRTKEYQEFLKTGKYRSNLLQFSGKTTSKELTKSHSDSFKPTLTLKPDFILVDGSEYGHMDYTLAMQAELSMRLAKGTIISTRYNVPLALTDNFDDGGIFDYRNRNKTSTEMDQLLLSQYLQFDLPYRWISLVQIGQFDKELTGGSVESSISTLDGRHTLTVKASQLKDDMYEEMDRYYEEDRNEELISYQYYMDSLNSNLKITAGDFLYGDSGTMLSLERYFSDTIVKFSLAQTEHRYKGEHNVAKLTLSVPFGTTKRIKSKYLDIQGDYLTYNRRKTVDFDDEPGYAQPLHLKEVDNSFTLEKYYLNQGRFHPAYIKSNYNRLRNVFLGN